MDGDVELLKGLYDRFNARDIDGILTALADDVAWANGMDGGHVHGREAVRHTGRGNGPWSVRTLSRSVFIGLRTARSSQKSGSPSAISKADRSKGRRMGSKTRRSDTFSIFEMARWPASTSRTPPNFAEAMPRAAALCQLDFVARDRCSSERPLERRPRRYDHVRKAPSPGGRSRRRRLAISAAIVRMRELRRRRAFGLRLQRGSMR